jgi:hypothetical protein
MMKLCIESIRWFPVVLVVALALALGGCGKEPEGPAEKAGKAVDETAEKAEQGVKDAADATGEKLEEAGEAIKKSAD